MIKIGKDKFIDDPLLTNM